MIFWLACAIGVCISKEKLKEISVFLLKEFVKKITNRLYINEKN